jgi:hypothetical protein
VFIRYFAAAIPADKKQLIVQENSAVIDVAKKVSPAVVSITSKTVTRGVSLAAPRRRRAPVPA